MHKPTEIAEISLALWYLPLPQLEEVKQLVLRLRKESGYDQPIDDSDEWTRQDELDFSEATWRRLDEEELKEESGHAEAG
jgi:hypothetical protein